MDDASKDVVEPSGEAPPWTSDAVEEQGRLFRETARELFLADGYHSAMVFLFVSVHPDTKERGAGIVAIQNQGDFAPEKRSQFSRMIRTKAKELEAVGVIFVSEVWTLTEASTEKYDEWLRDHPDGLESHPNRVEALLFTLETARHGSRMWTAQILRDDQGKPSLAPWVEVEGMKGRSGRFVNLLPMTS